MSRTHPDEKILSYNDVVLRRSDLDILNGPYFVNDRIVEFYFSYLSSTCCSSEEVLLVPPSISFWISNCPILEDVKDVVAPLRLQDRKLIIFPVNNNEDVSVAEGGSHWSLLSYYKTCNLFEHYDSFGSLNKRHAMKLCKGIKGLVGAETMSNFRECNTPQQMNGHDCGLYMLAIAELLCRCHLQEPNDSGQYRFEALQLFEVGQMRRRILKIIEDLRDQVEKESA